MTQYLLTILLTLSIAASGPSFAQTNALCGDPPRVDDSRVKAELDGKASFLSKYIGGAGLRGQVDIAKEDVLRKYPNADQLSLKKHFAYVMCVFIQQDTKLSPREKANEYLEKVRPIILESSTSENWEKLRKEHPYVAGLQIADRVLAASAIMEDSCQDKTLWTNEVSRAFNINQVVLESTLRQLRSKGMVTYLRSSPKTDKFQGQGILTYQLTDKAGDYIGKKQLIRP